ncbi:MAG: ribonuclease R [Aphanocapsa lilacina HA4352-LM1]|nr:ribonuclease R [Aphanocapsa lilacina HA4352-LM1]
MERGTLVEFRLQGGRRLGVVSGPDGKKNLNLQTQTGNTQTVHPRQITYQVAGGPYRTSELSAFESQVQNYLDQADLEVAWELFRESQALVSPEDLAQLLFDTAAPAACYAAHCLLSEDRLYFKQKGDGYEPRPSAQVEELRHQQAVEQRKAQEQARFLARVQSVLGGAAVEWEPSDRLRLDALERYALWGEEASDRAGAQDVLSQLGHTTRSEDAIALLVALRLWSPHENIHLRRSGIPVHFGTAVIEHARKLLENPPVDPASRRDFGRLAIYTIDDESTREIDDGLSLEMLEDGCEKLWVHIADPTRWVQPGDLLEAEARRRATSVYLPTGAIPMFPPELATGPMSLLPGQLNCALSFGAIVGPDGAVEHFEVTPALVRTVYPVTYEEADPLIASGEEPVLARLHEIALALRRRRHQCGAVSIDLPEAQVKVKDDEIRLEILGDSASRLLVSEMMILAGELAARLAIEAGIPVPFRTQPAPELPPADELLRLPAGPVREFAVCRCMQRGEVSVYPARHAGLGLDAYTQATSPIRRYSDLLVHFQIKAHLRGEPPPLTLEHLKELLAMIDAAGHEVTQIERLSERYWIYEYLRHRRHQVQPGLVLDYLGGDPQRALVLLENVALRLPVRLDRPVSKGEMVDLQIVQVDPRQDLLVLKEVRQAH